MIDITLLSPNELEKFIHIQSLLFRQSLNHREIKEIRKYYAGENGVVLSRRQEEFINLHGKFGFTHNVFGLIVDTVVERISLNGLSTVNKSLTSLWSDQLMRSIKSIENELYRKAYVDGKSFLFVDYNQGKSEFKLLVKQLDDGDSGVVPIYDPVTGEMIMATLYFWDFAEKMATAATVQKKIVYLPHEIRKYRMNGGGWQEDGSDWLVDWTDSNGEPIGIPLIEFNLGMRDKVESLIGLQDVLNKSWVDLIATMDLHGFPLITIEDPSTIVATSGDDDITGDDELVISPGRILRDAGKINRIEAADLNPVIDGIWSIVLAMASVSKVPHYYLRHPTQSVNGDALSQLEKGLTSLVQVLQDKLDSSWRDVISVMVGIDDAFGDLGVTDDDIDITWVGSEVRNDLHDAQIAHLHWLIGVPRELLLQRIGYTIQDVERLGGFTDNGGTDQGSSGFAGGDSTRLGASGADSGAVTQ